MIHLTRYVRFNPWILLIKLRGTEFNRRINLFRGLGRFDRGLVLIGFRGNGTWGPFLERPGNLTGSKSYFEIKFSGKVGCVLTSNEVHFVSLVDNFTVKFSNFLKLLYRMKNKTA